MINLFNEPNNSLTNRSTVGLTLTMRRIIGEVRAKNLESYPIC